jgi:hypothetical protein
MTGRQRVGPIFLLAGRYATMLPYFYKEGGTMPTDPRRIVRAVPQFIAAAASVGALLAAFVTYAYQQRRDAEIRKLEALTQQKQALDAEAQVNRVLEESKDLEKRLLSVAGLPAKVGDESSVGKLQVQITTLRADVDKLSTSVSEQRNTIDSLNRAFLPDPEKALSIPLLRKDVDQIRTGNQHDIDALRDDIKANLDLNKWLIGLIAAGMLGTILNNMLQGRRADGGSKPRVE